MNAPTRKSLLERFYVPTVAKVLLYVVLLLIGLSAYCKMKAVLHLMYTMLQGWAIMLDVLIESGLLQGPERLRELVNIIMQQNGNINPQRQQ